jgi:hypothetical protein
VTALALLPQRTRTSVLLATARLLKAPGAAEVGMSRRPDLARPVELSVARRPSSGTASALLVDQPRSQRLLQQSVESKRRRQRCVRLLRVAEPRWTSSSHAGFMKKAQEWPSPSRICAHRAWGAAMCRWFRRHRKEGTPCLLSTDGPSGRASLLWR